MATLTIEGELTIFDEDGLELDSLSIFEVSQKQRKDQEQMKVLAVSEDSTNIAVAAFTSANRPSRIFWLHLDDESHVYLVSELDVSQRDDFDIRGLCFMPNKFSQPSKEYSRDRRDISDFSLTGKLEPCSSPKKAAPLYRLSKLYPSS